ncbi:MAG TPA: substrate-binding domain-containing protein [Clostridiaceae bacterium]|nr:substrate-binding domain-containing protein [Clostridiaceae bacterium]
MAVTQQQIADLAGVSRGTVHRALNKSGSVKPEVAQRILEIADELGYQPNRAGSMLVRTHRPLQLGVIIQSTETPFIQEVLSEIEAARADIKNNGAELIIYTNEQLDITKQLQALNELAEKGVDGISLAPIQDHRVVDKINKLTEQGIPVVTFNTDLPDSERLCYVGQDNFQSGRACASLMNGLLGGTGKVLIVTGYHNNISHRRRTEGFSQEMQQVFNDIELLPVVACQDNRELAAELVTQTIAEHPDLKGIYNTANGQLGTCDAVKALGLGKQIHMICHDLVPENIANLKNGLIDFIIDQGAQTQAVQPIHILIDFLIGGSEPEQDQHYTHIDIYNSYNLAEPI